jgi:beta-mannanase
VDLIPTSLGNQNNPSVWEQSCAAGQFNAYAQQLGTNLVTAGLGNSVIRLGPEMNGPWEVDFMGTTTAEQNMWASCFANEVTALRQATGEHFLFVWNPNACYENVPYTNYYPGNAYVDILGLDLYNGLCTVPSTSTVSITWGQLASEPSGLGNFEAFAKTLKKPMSFPEWGLLKNPNGDDAAYINGIGSTIASGNFSFETYFDAGDHGVLQVGTSTPRALVAFRKWFKQDSFPGRTENGAAGALGLRLPL